MANILLGQIKKQTSSFLHEKFKTARMMFTDVTPAELLAEEATNNDPCTPDAKTMTRIAEASYEVEDYWRIVDVLHRRLYNNDWKQWRQSYKALVLLEFLLTHGPEEFAEEFVCDIYIIRDLSTFEHKDDKGFDWGNHMQKKSERILALLKGGETLKQARLRALKVTNEIQGFGNLMNSPTSSSSSPSSSRTSSSFGSYSTTSSTWNDFDAFSKYEFSKELCGGIDEEKSNAILNDKNNVEGSHIWDCCISNEEKGSLLDYEEREEKEEENKEDDDDVNYDDNYNKPCGFFGRMRSRFGGRGDFRSLSDVDNVNEQKMVRQFSTKY